MNNPFNHYSERVFWLFALSIIINGVAVYIAFDKPEPLPICESPIILGLG